MTHSASTSEAPIGAASAAPEVVAGRFTLTGERLRGLDFTVHRARDASGTEVSLLCAPLAALGPRRGALETDLSRAQRNPIRGICRTLGFGVDGERFFVVSELPEGHSLRRAIDARAAQGQPVGGRAAHTLLGQLATALAEAYRTMAHGALTPDTIVVGRDAAVLLEHWGVARGLPSLARTGATAAAQQDVYVAPEVAGGAPPSAQADVYALGGILFELLTGQAPTVPLRPASQLVAELGPVVDAVLAKARAKNPLGRQGTPQILLNELASALKLPGIQPPASSLPGAPGPALPQASGLPIGGLPRPSSSMAVARPSARGFNVAEAAGLDTDSERWLIQKGKLDFGPFSLAQLKAEIERGSFGSSDVVVDTETGERSHLGKHPQLGDFTRQAEQRLESARRAHADAHLERAERKKGNLSRVVIGLAVAALALGAGLYLYGRKSGGEDVLAARVAEADIDAFLKGVKIAFNQPRKPNQGRPRATGASKGGADEFDSSLTLGDVSKGGGDAVLDEGAIQDTMMRNYRGLVPCIMQARQKDPGLSNIDLDFVVLGTGKVSAVKVNGQQATPLATCVLERMKQFKFPAFDGAKTIASWSMSLR